MMMTTTTTRTRTRRWKMLQLACSGLLVITALNNYIFYTRQAIDSIHPAELVAQQHHGEMMSVDDAATLEAFWFPSTSSSSTTTTHRHMTRIKTTEKHAIAVARHYSTNNIDNADVVVDTRRDYRQQQETATPHNRLHQLVDIVIQDINSINDDDTTNKRSITRNNNHDQQQQQRQQQQQQGTTNWLWRRRKTNNDNNLYNTRIHENNDISNSNNDDNNSNVIRSWGCHLTQTPLIYIHIGKAGGGQVRAKFAASSQNLNELLVKEKQEQQRLLLQNRNVTKRDLAAINWFRYANNRAYYIIHDENNNNNDNHSKDQPLLHGRRSTLATNQESSLSNSTRVYFCNSRHSNFRVHANIEMYEGTTTCYATTPLGQAVACPEQMERMIANEDGCHGCGNASSENCHVVYLGHNLLGNELHWLPFQYLINWWLSSPWSIKTRNQQQRQRPQLQDWHSNVDDDDNNDIMHSYLKTLMPDNTAWCPEYNLSRPMRQQQLQGDVYLKCSIPLAHAVDEVAIRVLQQQQETPQTRHKKHVQYPQQHHYHQNADDMMMMDWSPVYASLPVLRTTILREPFSWLVSRFFWHGNDDFFSCKDIDTAGEQHQQQYKEGAAAAGDDEDDDCRIHQGHGRGWANRYALLYIFYLCGEDCAARYELSCSNNNIHDYNAKQTRHRLLLAQMEQQAANNLRQSFAVVGLLNETDTFYDMVASRVQYMANMTSSSSSSSFHDDQDRRHSTEGGMEQQRCKALYQNNITFQNELMNRSPALAALHRLFQIGVQVNRFQIQELKQECGMTAHHRS